MAQIGSEEETAVFSKSPLPSPDEGQDDFFWSQWTKREKILYIVVAFYGLCHILIILIMSMKRMNADILFILGCTMIPIISIVAYQIILKLEDMMILIREPVGEELFLENRLRYIRDLFISFIFLTIIFTFTIILMISYAYIQG